MKKLDLMQETMYTRKPRQKERTLERNRREKRYDWIAIYFEETIHIRDNDCYIATAHIYKQD